MAYSSVVIDPHVGHFLPLVIMKPCVELGDLFVGIQHHFCIQLLGGKTLTTNSRRLDRACV